MTLTFFIDLCIYKIFYAQKRNDHNSAHACIPKCNHCIYLCCRPSVCVAGDQGLWSVSAAPPPAQSWLVCSHPSLLSNRDMNYNIVSCELQRKGFVYLSCVIVVFVGEV